MEIMGITNVAAITIICLLIGLWVKTLRRDDRWIPCIVGTAGCALGALGWKIMPGFPADNLLTALAVGVVSGLAATGTHQIYKQLAQKPPDESGTQDKPPDAEGREGA